MAPSKYKKVLIIDDDDIDIFVLRKTMENCNFAETIVSKIGAIEGLDYLKSIENNVEELPEIILLDIYMPGMNGFGFMDEYANLNNAVHEKCKVIMMSSSNQIEDLNRANKNKMVARFFLKPIFADHFAVINY